MTRSPQRKFAIAGERVLPLRQTTPTLASALQGHHGRPLWSKVDLAGSLADRQAASFAVGAPFAVSSDPPAAARLPTLIGQNSAP